jgi:HK97 family phage prohead protease
MSDRIEIKATLNVADDGTITGLAWPFGSPDRMGDEIQPGAFKSAKPPLPMLAYHDPAAPVGAWSSITETAKGLEVSGRLLVDDIPAAAQMRALVKAGAVSGLSIGFVTRKAEAKKGGGRILKAVDVVEVSLVTVPMHPGAKVTSIKSAARALKLAAAINRAATALSRSNP